MCTVYHYIVDLPNGVKGFCMPCCDGFCIYTDSRLDSWTLRKTLCHELSHIEYGDFELEDVQRIECEAHGRSEKPLEYYWRLFEEQIVHCGYVEAPKM